MTKRGLAAVLLSSLLMFLGASVSRASAGPYPTPAATAPEPGGPLARIVQLLDDINAGDIAAMYAALTPEVQQGFSQAELQSALNAFQEGAGPLHVTISRVGAVTLTGDQAEIELTLRVQAGSLDVTLEDVATLVRLDGEWRLGDHFIQTALTALGLYRPGPLVRAFDARGCVASNVLEGVYASGRLRVLDPCMTATGIVHNLEHSTDGDISFEIALPPEQLYLLDPGNTPGLLVVEIVPGDQGRVATPSEGDLVRVTGPWVTDEVHGHNEIHPAWLVERLTPPATPGTAALPGSGSGGQSGAAAPLYLLALAGAIALCTAAWLRRHRAGG